MTTTQLEALVILAGMAGTFALGAAIVGLFVYYLHKTRRLP
jgi:hypothetical protein